jgi:hypothetical protein
METFMKIFLIGFLIVCSLTVNACSPSLTSPAPTPTPAPNPVLPTQTPTLIVKAPTSMVTADSMKSFTNRDFGLAFKFPSGWFGPDEYISDQTIRVEIGSDTVYPYGADRSDQTRQLKDSYTVILQYSKNDQNQVWKDSYQSLINLKDGESLSNGRGIIIRIRQINLDRFHGFETISTLSDTAQTEPLYARQVILIDDHSNVLSIFGTPNNVEVKKGANWRDIYRQIDEQNLKIFHEIVDSVIIK